MSFSRLQHLTYRPHIDGLRGFAVLLVLLFHAFPDDVPGGFIGVDLFFVISGYLITQLIGQERGEGQFHYGRFLLRRVRRLAPAFLLVGTVSLLVGMIGFLPDHLARNAAAFGSSLLLSSNWYFFASTDYFAADNWTNLYLHNWSLSVEEQYYLFYPLLLMALPGKYLRKGLVALLLLSFVVAVVSVSAASPERAFFATWNRVWELLLGCVLAIYREEIGLFIRSRPIALKLVQWSLVPGLLVIMACAGLITEESGIPGAILLVPLIAFLPALLGRDLLGDKARGGSGMLLENKGTVYLGRISYALYLWHWPILTLVRHLTYDPEDWMMALALIPAFGLASLTYHVVEQPIRQRRVLIRPLHLLGGVAAVWAMAMCLVAAVHLTNGLPGRIPPEVAPILAGAEDRGGEERRCPYLADGDPLKSDPLWTERRLCFLGGEGSRDIDILLWGDSHAGAIVPGLAALAERSGLNIAVLDKASCPPLLGLGWTSFSRDSALACEAHNEAAARLIETGRVPVVLLVGHWDIFAPRPDGRPGSSIAVGGSFAPEGMPSTRLEQFGWSLDYTVTRIAPHTELRVLFDVPSHPRPVPDALARAALWPFLPSPAVETRAQVAAKRQTFLSNFQALVEDGVLTLYDPVEILCPEDKCLTQDKEGHPLYFDDNHLSATGSRYLIDAMPAFTAPAGSSPIRR
ncbi:acyltransferase family protein [Parvularcula marina]|uniref:acyltransferase family protein n=1 Tax=Parvularcula marina TaxID=2292771 RepID=UPI0035191E65